MSEWTHDLIVVVPAGLMQQANQLALMLGTSDADAETFKQADFAVEIITNNDVEGVDEDGNPTSSIEKVISYGAERYAIVSTKAVEGIITYFNTISTAQQSDEVLTNALLNTLFVASDFSNSDMTKIQVFFDIDPFIVLDKLNLVRLDE